MIIDKFHRYVEFILAGCLVMCATLNAVTPFCYEIAGLFAINILQGWFEALVNIGQSHSSL